MDSSKKSRGPGRPRVAEALVRRTYGISLAESTISKLKSLASTEGRSIGEVVDGLTDREYSRRKNDAVRQASLSNSPRRGLVTQDELDAAVEEIREQAKESPQLGGAPRLLVDMFNAVRDRDRTAAAALIWSAYSARSAGNWFAIPFSQNVFERLINAVEELARR